ncbi:pyruvate formate lyase family protein [Clostridium sp.]|uniref:pyruvate formate lyase family protein n=1 Tax=Clostridium sp. TaxID=1506 RepID=UPI001A3D2829|nr:pyruvate formate lyase family protein [Clostridium sp.]MBK5236860.1 hypothetical protein [Clostridium sp.]
MYDINGMNDEQKAQYFINFTKIYKEGLPLYKGNREAMILDFQYPQLCIKKQKGEIFVSRCLYPPLMFSPQSNGSDYEASQLGYCFDIELFLKIENSINISAKLKLKLSEIRKYWDKEKTTNKIRKAYPTEMAQALKVENYAKDKAVSYPIYRMSGTQLNYSKLLDKGISGLENEIKKKIETTEREIDERSFLSACLSWLHTFSKVCITYADDLEKNDKLKDCMNHIATKPPETFYQALQLVLLWWTLSGSLNLERMDIYISKFYVRDIDNKIITEEEALELLSLFYKQLEIRNHIYDTRIVIGGKDRKNLNESDRFCILSIKAIMKNRGTVPQLTLRCYQGMNENVWKLALEANGKGCTFPMLYNDDVNIKAVSEAFNLPLEEANNYCPFGCGEYVIAHKSVGTPSDIINLAKALEITLNRGRDLETEEKIGLNCGYLEDFKTFRDLFKAYKRQVEYFVSYSAQQQKIEYEITSKEVDFLPFSILYDDCIERKKPLLSGGVKYLGGTLESYGNVNTADSLTAINELVYKKKEVTLQEVYKAMKANFIGYEDVQKKMIDCPKYGNDNEIADKMLVDVNKHICNFTRNQASVVGLDSYLIVIINNNTNTLLGKITAATADGRKANTYLANANNPQGSADNKGLTAMLNSIVKPSIKIHAGSVQNLKLSKSMFSSRMLNKTQSIIKVYFQNGGSQLMLTVISPGEMKDAVIHPENHQNLLVRIGGFSARFIDLEKEVQKELISRTLY